ncbi:MAG: hypothetical protein IPM34_06480 [Saprospiraceae bacterium]|nr:hypothetical protein [Saprospiraceae bacterium]
MEILSFGDLLKIILKNLRTLVTIAICTAIGAAVIAMILPVYYTSTTVIFPVKLSQAPVNETSFRRGNISDFGETGEAEQALEILNSTSLMDRVIEKFDLFTHYEIPRNGPAALTFTRRTFSGNVGIKRTKFNSIEITVQDKKPEMAANIANAIAQYLDTLKYEMVKLRANELIGNLELQHAKQQLIIDSLKTQMDSMTKKRDHEPVSARIPAGCIRTIIRTRTQRVTSHRRCQYQYGRRLRYVGKDIRTRTRKSHAHQ